MTSPTTTADNRSLRLHFAPWIGCGLLLLSVLTAGCSSTPTNYRNIQEVDRLCAKDGGIRVYEQVKLPATLFAPDGLPNSRKLESDFIFDISRMVLPAGQGQHIERIRSSVSRKADGTPLGEAVNYTYSYGSEHASVPFYKTHSCPGLERASPSFVLWRKVFVRAAGEPQ